VAVRRSLLGGGHSEDFLTFEIKKKKKDGAKVGTKVGAGGAKVGASGVKVSAGGAKAGYIGAYAGLRTLFLFLRFSFCNALLTI